MKEMAAIMLADVINVMKQKGYQIFNDIRPNIVGIRNSIKDSNQFDDICFVWWSENGNVLSHQYTITTHPGYYYLQHPIAGTKGSAILVPGQYIDIWTLGMHRKKQFALCERSGPVKVYRDNNKDTKLDYDPKTIQEGWFGIDGHHAGLNDADAVGPYSAGCQVWRYHQAHQDLMQDLKRISNRAGFTKFGYTLLSQEDFTI